MGSGRNRRGASCYRRDRCRACRRTPRRVRRSALAAVQHAGRGRRRPADRSTRRAAIRRAANLIPRLPSLRRAPVAVALDQIGGFPVRLTGPAPRLVGQLKANSNDFQRHSPPPGQDRHHGRRRPRLPLLRRALLRVPSSRGVRRAEPARLGEGRRRDERLGNALVARGVHQFGGIGWEYYFAFGGGSAPWLSGMAQAVAAQGFARAANLVPESRIDIRRGRARAHTA